MRIAHLVLVVGVVPRVLGRRGRDLEIHRAAAAEVRAVGDCDPSKHFLEIPLLRRVGLIADPAANRRHGFAVEGFVEGQVLDDQVGFHGRSPESSVKGWICIEHFRALSRPIAGTVPAVWRGSDIISSH
ncbi:hypothetical protein ebA1658 [Aromatoleum aromaticum EbN1]|uniref:Uncharacterized protein n=1 Tax=Aromatoleum aromaticum (strain DSM 19018 / LMG 30748 / EbN1) TaxID=76114 RepID=Q5P6N6_AROAE|nr:hypothetical protein ebA1658 [Aromatoleum aromaticum EbN1]